MFLEKSPQTDATFERLLRFRAPWWTDGTNLVAQEAVSILHGERRPLIAFNLRLAMCDAFMEAAVRGYTDTGAIPIFEISEPETKECDVPFEYLRDRVVWAMERWAPRGYPFLLWGDHIKLGTSDYATELARQAIDLGFSGFQADGSHAFPDDIEGNVRTTAGIAGKLRDGQMIEGEINAIGSAKTTTPEDAETFLTLCREQHVPIAWLAIQNGTKHGPTDGIKRFVLDLEGSQKIGDVTARFGIKWSQHGSSYSAPESLVYLPHIGCGKLNWATEGSDVAILAYPELEQSLRTWCDNNRDQKGKPALLKQAIHAFGDEFEHLPAAVASRVREAVYRELTGIIGIAGAGGAVGALLTAKCTKS
ncbi:MAG: class II fructose-bisphosphate aldolase [Candidatus Latescibacterota bacterium]